MSPLENLKSLEMSALIDMLARHTNDYTRMMTDGAAKHEFETCKQTIDLLQKEILSRKEKFTDNTTTTTDSDISPDYSS